MPGNMPLLEREGLREIGVGSKGVCQSDSRVSRVFMKYARFGSPNKRIGLSVALKFGRDQPEKTGALSMRHSAPRAIVKSCAGSRYRPIDVRRARLGDRLKEVFGGAFNYGERRTPGRFYPVAVDEQSVGMFYGTDDSHLVIRGQA